LARPGGLSLCALLSVMAASAGLEDVEMEVADAASLAAGGDAAAGRRAAAPLDAFQIRRRRK